jgi:lincosamide nucleotidyltransferase A/C/D/E
MTNEHDVIDLLKAIDEIGVSVWIGGGWGVDALVGFQSRPHDDIDVYMENKNAGVFIEMLASKGYQEIETEYTTESHIVWQDSSNRTIDLHLLEFEGTETLYFEGEAYPSNILNGEGIIGGVAVRCFPAEAQLLFHQGYEHSKKDTHDVLLLCKTFGIDIPAQYGQANDDEIS